MSMPYAVKKVRFLQGRMGLFTRPIKKKNLKIVKVWALRVPRVLRVQKLRNASLQAWEEIVRL